MSKQILVAVHCANEFGSDIPEAFTIAIDSFLSMRIKELSGVVRLHGIHATEEFDYSGVWSKELIEPEDIPEDLEGMTVALEKFTSTPVSVELSTLRVTASHFSFTAIPKHCNGDMELSTERIEISVLDGSETVIVRP